MLERGLVDAYVTGEGEQPILDLLEGRSGPGINGAPPVQLDDLDAYLFPDYSDFDLAAYPENWLNPLDQTTSLGASALSITGSCGCVRRCSFCDVSQLWPKYRYRAGRRIAEEVQFQF